MYGMVNQAVEEMVIGQFGESIWEEIKARAGVEVEVFISNDPYPDEITYRLVGAASEVLRIPADQVLEAFGEHWVLNTARKGYGSLMKAGGKNLRDFLVNLPNFHTRVAMIFPRLQPPSFTCTEITDNSLNLHYRTHRSGMTSFAVGLIRGLGKMFQTPTVVTVTQSTASGADHDVFHIQWETKPA